MIFTGTELVVPAGRAKDAPIIVDLGAILRAEQRQDEVAFCTSTKAPELLREFNVAWRDLHKITVMLAAEQLHAERELERRRAVLTLDVVPSLLKEKGLTSTVANINAAITLDEKFQTLQETVDQIDAVVRYLKGKLTSFENAFTSIKKLIGEDTTWMQARQNPNLKGGTESKPVYSSPAAEAASTPAIPPASTGRAGFGRPKY